MDLKPYQPRTFASPAPRGGRCARATVAPVDLPFNLDGISTEATARTATSTARGGPGRRAAAEGPALAGVDFRFGDTKDGALNVVAAKGQRIALPAGAWNRLYILATAVGGDVKNAAFTVERRGAAPVPVRLGVQEWTGAIGQWDSRLLSDKLLREPYLPEIKDQSWPLAEIESQIVTRWQPGPPAIVQGLDQVRPGFVKRDEVAWVATHRHAPQENEIYIFGYVFKYGVTLPPGATSIVLPTNEHVRILAMSVASVPAPDTRAATLLYAPELGAPAARSLLGRGRQ